MKVGVVTHWWCFENYGQLLQCYAFQQFLKTRGHDPFLIRWFPSSDFGDRMTILRILRKAMNPVAFMRSVWYRLSGVTKAIAARKARIAPLRDFDGFRAKNLTVSKTIYRSYKELRWSSEVDADMYSVGSDVVWKMIPLNDDGRMVFLDFGRPSAKRIAYSPSFGVSNLTSEYKRFAAPLIQKLDYVSVREPSGVKLCAEMGRSDAVCVMDPVFLLNRMQWIKYFDIPSSREGLFAYWLSSKVDFPLEEARGEAYRRGTRLRITTVYGDCGLPQELLYDPMIPDWIRCVGSSQMIVTNSFHCVSMAIILHIPFVTILRDNGNGMDTRLISILQRTGLTGRIYEKNVNPISRISSTPIDWEIVDQRVRNEVAQSIRFLEKVGL